MITIGVRELKSRLSECIRMVREGGEVYVTHRGETVAELRPPSHVEEDKVSAELRRRARGGKVRLGARNRADVYVRPRCRLPAATVQALLRESRGER